MRGEWRHGDAHRAGTRSRLLRLLRSGVSIGTRGFPAAAASSGEPGDAAGGSVVGGGSALGAPPTRCNLTGPSTRKRAGVGARGLQYAPIRASTPVLWHGSGSPAHASHVVAQATSVELIEALPLSLNPVHSTRINGGAQGRFAGFESASLVDPRRMASHAQQLRGGTPGAGETH